MNRVLLTQYLPPLCVEPDPKRLPKRYSLREINRLVADIREHGVKPVRVRETDGRWFVVSGERRRQACIAAGLEAMPVVIVQHDKAAYSTTLKGDGDGQRTA